jgi:hypothetical protein
MGFALACALAVLGGCGGDDDAREAAKPARSATGVTQARIDALTLGAAERDVRAALGRPTATIERPKFRCHVYPTAAGGDTWLRLCFFDGKLGSLATVIGKQTALAVDPVKVEGPGKVVPLRKTERKPFDDGDAG